MIVALWDRAKLAEDSVVEGQPRLGRRHVRLQRALARRGRRGDRGGPGGRRDDRARGRQRPSGVGTRASSSTPTATRGRSPTTRAGPCTTTGRSACRPEAGGALARRLLAGVQQPLRVERALDLVVQGRSRADHWRASWPRFTQPTPCSPETEPPSRTASSNSSPAACSRPRELRLVVRRRRGTSSGGCRRRRGPSCTAGRSWRAPIASVSSIASREPVERDDDVLAHLAAALRRRRRTRRRRASARAPSTRGRARRRGRRARPRRAPRRARPGGARPRPASRRPRRAP